MPTLTFDALWRDRGVARGLKELGDGADKSHRKLSALSELGPKLAGAFAGLEIADFLHDSIKAAGDLNETVNKSQAIFGASSGEIDAWSRTAAKSMGLSRQAALAASAQFGDMFTQIGFGRRQAVDLSKSTVQLAADLGSFNNLQTDDVLERISAAYRGEYDSLQLLIPNISAARVEQTALTLTHKASTSALTAQDKALAVNAILHQDGARAIGDYARTASGAANTEKTLAAQFEDTKAAVGEALLPVYQEFLTLVQRDGLPALEALAKVLGSIPTPVFEAALAFGGLYAALKAGNKTVEVTRGFAEAAGTAMEALGLRTSKAAIAAEASGQRFGKLRAGVGGLTSFLTGPWGIALAVGATAVATWAEKHAEAERRVNDLTDAIKADSGALGENTRQKIVNRLESDGLLAIAQRLGISLQDVTDAALGNADATARVNAALSQYRHVSEGLDDAGGETFTQNEEDASKLFVALGDVNSELGQARASYQRTAAAAQTTSGATQQLTSAQKDNAAATQRAKEKLDRQIGALRDATNAFLDARGAARDLVGAQNDLSEAIRKNGRGLSINSEKGRENAEALDRVAKATLSDLEAKRAAGAPLAAYRRAIDRARDSLIDEARQAGMSKAAAQAYAETILRVPRKQLTTYVTPGLAGARAGAQGLANDLRGIANRTIRVRINSDGSFTQLYTTSSGGRKSARGFAAGGPVGGGVRGRDSVPALLMPDEHVWTTSEVAGAGGHGNVMRLRRAAASGFLRFAAGGPVVATRYSASLPASGALGAGLDRALLWAAKNYGGGYDGPVPGGSGVGRWAGMVRAALQALGLSAGLVPRVLRQIATESGGNPRALQQVHDVNWPNNRAQGLMQVIPPTFRAFHMPGTSWNPYDPWANIMAGLNYARHRYGPGLGALGQGHGYDAGGIARGAGFLAKFTQRPERVLSPAMTSVFDRTMARVAATGGRGGDTYITVTAPNYLGREEQLLETMDRWSRNGRMDRIVRQAKG